MRKPMFKFLLALLLLSCVSQAMVVQADNGKQRTYKMPAYKSSFIVSPEVYKKAADYYATNYKKLSKRDKFVIIDFSLHASKPRLLYLDIANKSFTTHLVSAGAGSDPDGDGYATKFSNTSDSKMSSLGAYLTLKTYTGKYGYSLYLKGLDSTNDNAEKRAIVMHPASYVSEANKHAGRSWGCPAVDPLISRDLIDNIKDGVIIFVATK
ncbi:hypothetical protein C4J81_02985 [Deltaproteobacteria bacterium Smac51]|nr:hypothetical protein C4J81_02985 [Deltaproteobacteria bacterium Smac51]